MSLEARHEISTVNFCFKEQKNWTAIFEPDVCSILQCLRNAFTVVVWASKLQQVSGVIVSVIFIYLSFYFIFFKRNLKVRFHRELRYVREG